MKAAVLYYKIFVKNLKSIGFALNPYDPCVTNKTFQYKQLTVVWHVDDIKVAHVDLIVVANIEYWLKKTYSCVFGDGSGEMRLARRNIHEYLGMTLYFSTDGEVMITMIPYVTEIVTLFLQHGES